MKMFAINNIRRWVIRAVTLCLVLVVAACSSTRKLSKEPSVGGLTGIAYLEKVIENAPDWDRISGKVTMTLSASGKSSRFSATMRIKRGQAIQFSVAPLLGIEMVRMEISPAGLLIIDRLHKRYVEVPFSSLDKLAKTGLDFDVFQALFLNELFLPGKGELSIADASQFTISSVEERVHLQVKRKLPLVYTFLTTVEEGWLEESRIIVPDSPYALRWTYRDFKAVDKKPFPAAMEVDIAGAGKPLSVSMQFSRLSVGGDWEVHTEIPSKYQRMSVEELLKLFVK